GHEGVGPGLRNLADVLGVDPAVHFQTDITPAGVNQRSRLAQLVQGGGDELLPAEAGVDAHQQDHVDLVHHVPEHIQRGRRIEYQPGFGAAIADQLQGSVDMVAGFRVEGDVTGPRLQKVADDAIHRPHHQMYVDWRRHAVFAQGTADHGTYGEVGHVMVVHYIEVDNVSTRRQHPIHIFPEAGEIGGQNGRGNRVIRHGRPQGSDRNRAILPCPAPPGATSSSPGRDEHQLVRLVRGVAGGTLSGYRDTDA